MVHRVVYFVSGLNFKHSYDNVASGKFKFFLKLALSKGEVNWKIIHLNNL
jgi:hypothetical protein